MNLFRKLLGGGAKPPGAPAPSGDDLEPFDYPVKIVYVPERGAALVWKTHTAGVTGDEILLQPPNSEWESSLPLDRAVTVVLTASGRMAEFDATIAVKKRGGRTLLAAPRPAELEWTTTDSGAQQSRKFLRVDVSLSARVATILPTSPGVAAKTSEPRIARIQDLSLEGMSARMDYQANAGDRLEVTITNPGFNIQLQARVVRVKQAEGDLPYVAALAFDQLSTVNREMIGSYVLNRQRNT